jgi:hypothetical protein
LPKSQGAPSGCAPRHLPFPDLATIKNPGDLLVPVEHDAAELLVRQDAFDAEVLQGAVGDAEHLPDVGAFQPFFLKRVVGALGQCLQVFQELQSKLLQVFDCDNLLCHKLNVLVWR